jgi:predicted AAA+ superfamily ATPase
LSDEVAPFSAAGRSAKPGTNAFISPRSFGCGCAALRLGRQEVDFVIEHGRKLVAVEVKATGRLNMDDTRSLRDFLRRTPSCVAGVLTYFGEEILPLGETTWAVPLHCLLS